MVRSVVVLPARVNHVLVDLERLLWNPQDSISFKERKLKENKIKQACPGKGQSVIDPVLRPLDEPRKNYGFASARPDGEALPGRIAVEIRVPLSRRRVTLRVRIGVVMRHLGARSERRAHRRERGQ